MVYLVQQDLNITRNFADFLRRSNEAFKDDVVPPEQSGEVELTVAQL